MTVIVVTNYVFAVYLYHIVLDRTSYRLVETLDTLLATRIVSREGPRYATYRIEKARSVSTIHTLGPDP